MPGSIPLCRDELFFRHGHGQSMADEACDFGMIPIHVPDLKFEEGESAILRSYLCNARTHTRPDTVSAHDKVCMLLLSIAEEKVEATFCRLLNLRQLVTPVEPPRLG